MYNDEDRSTVRWGKSSMNPLKEPVSEIQQFTMSERCWLDFAIKSSVPLLACTPSIDQEKMGRRDDTHCKEGHALTSATATFVFSGWAATLLRLFMSDTLFPRRLGRLSFIFWGSRQGDYNELKHSFFINKVLRHSVLIRPLPTYKCWMAAHTQSYVLYSALFTLQPSLHWYMPLIVAFLFLLISDLEMLLP